MLEPTKGEWSDQTPPNDEWVGHCPYCECGVYQSEERTGVGPHSPAHLTCQDEYMYNVRETKGYDLRGTL